MTNGQLNRSILRAALLCALALGASRAFAAQMGTAFAYQGTLSVSNAPANGMFDLNFTLYDAASAGSFVGSTQAIGSVSVLNGFFKVNLDFGAAPFAGNARWLEIAVRPTGSAGGYTTLAPRQELKPTPYALTAGRVYSQIPGGVLGVSMSSDAGIPSIVFNYTTGTPGLTMGTTLPGASSTSLQNFYTPAGSIGADVGADAQGGFVGARYPNGSTGVFLDTSGNLGSTQVYNTAGQRLLYLGVGSTGGGILSLYNSGGTRTVLLDGQTGVKNFVAADPADPSKEIVYACPEGPEAAIYCRGTATLVNGEAIVDLPDHFAALCSPKGMTVQVTPQDAASLGCAVVERSPKGIHIRELGGGRGNYAIDWQVTGVRLGLEDYQPVRSKIEMQSGVGGGAKTGPERLAAANQALAKAALGGDGNGAQ